MLSLLEDDFYIERNNGKASFSSKLLRDWWKMHGVAGKR
jgi:hypothetical protein